MDEARLIEKLRLIEALFAGATTEGERVAAGEARSRIERRLEEQERADPAVEFRFALPDAWSRKVLLALVRRYGLRPYRYRGQRHTTVMVKAPRRFVEETLSPEFGEILTTLRRHLDEVTDRVVAEVIHRDSSEADEVAEPRQLGFPQDGGDGR
ncbi:MAG: hypothetical protein HYY06_07620 [Deltaproteobacteria bacterium]|nr:hypothetical protein [Deltaproteobacteria bacterium]